MTEEKLKIYDEVIAEAKERAIKAKKYAEKSGKKSEATKIKDAIVKVEDRVEDKFDKMSRADITKLIAETRSLLKQLEAALKKAK